MPIIQRKKIYYFTDDNNISKIEDIVDLPKSDVLRFWFNDGSWYAIRPSGTEPKLKIYVYAFDKEKKQCEKEENHNKKTIDDIISKII